MGRVLPSGRVFGEATDLPNIQFAQREKFGGRLQEVIESPVTDLAVAGISRIADELDYRDRLNAEKQRVAAADIEERKAQAALSALQEQHAAREQAMAEHQKQREIAANQYAQQAGIARRGGAEYPGFAPRVHGEGTRPPVFGETQATVYGSEGLMAGHPYFRMPGAKPVERISRMPTDELKARIYRAKMALQNPQAHRTIWGKDDPDFQLSPQDLARPVSYTHLTLPTNREV